MYTWIYIAEEQRFANNLNIHNGCEGLTKFNELWYNHTVKYYSVIRKMGQFYM